MVLHACMADLKKFIKKYTMIKNNLSNNLDFSIFRSIIPYETDY